MRIYILTSPTQVTNAEEIPVRHTLEVDAPGREYLLIGSDWSGGYVCQWQDGIQGCARNQVAAEWIVASF